MEEFDFEVQQPERKIKKTKKISKKNRKFKIILAVLVLLICVGLFALSKLGTGTVDDIFTFENNSNYQIAEYTGKILTVSYDGIRFLSVDGKQADMVENHMSNPHFNVSGDMILLYDRGGSHLAVYDGSKLKYLYENEQPIKVAKVNKKGYVVLISDEVAYNSKVTVLNDKGEVVYIWKIGDEYIVDADISPDNKHLVAATVTTGTGKIVENIVFVDVVKAEEIGRAKNEDDMPLQTEYSDSGNAIVISDNKLCSYDNKAKKKWEEGFDNHLLSSYTIDESGNTAVVLQGIKNNSIVKTYTKNGTNSGEYTTETTVLFIDQNQKNVAICEKTKISVLNYSGKVTSETPIQKEVEDMAVINGNRVILLCNDSIQLIKG